MLGKTNIMPLAEGTIATEIENYSWIKMPCGLNGNFVRTAQGGGYLAGITADGSVAYTTDGEVWRTVRLQYQDCRLEDIEWDGERFVLVGGYKPDEFNKGLILISTDLETYEQFEGQETTYDRTTIAAALSQNGKYITVNKDAVAIVWEKDDGTAKSEQLTRTTVTELKAVKGMGHMYTAWKEPGGGETYVINKTNIDKPISNVSRRNNIGNIFECKNEIYWMCLKPEENYCLYKITEADEFVQMCADQNFIFIDGVYFNGCRIFINRHEMLVLKKGENLADKTVEDLVEIAPESQINCITKAFGALYVFGDYGCILKSSPVTNNEQSVAAQAMSAKRALEDAKIYTAEEIRRLEGRIEALETKIGLAAGI